MIDTIGRARIIGVLLLVAAFGAGVAVGHYLLPRRLPEGVVLSVKSSGKIPAELEELDLTDAQRVEIRRKLNEGMLRVGRVLRGFSVPMDAAIDSTDRDIRTVLTQAQNAKLDEIRKERPLKRMREKRIIDTIR